MSEKDKLTLESRTYSPSLYSGKHLGETEKKTHNLLEVMLYCLQFCVFQFLSFLIALTDTFLPTLNSSQLLEAQAQTGELE